MKRDYEKLLGCPSAVWIELHLGELPITVKPEGIQSVNYQYDDESRLLWINVSGVYRSYTLSGYGKEWEYDALRGNDRKR
jgi:hypothetical protein